MKIRTSVHRTSTLICDEGEIELEFEPYNDNSVLVHREGDKLVVAYLVQDEDAGSCNPMENCASGNLYTKSPYSARDSVITDNDPEFYAALGLDRYGSINSDYVLEIDGCVQSLWDHAADIVFADLCDEDLCNALVWCNKYYSGMDLTDEELVALSEFNVTGQELDTYKARFKDQLLNDLRDGSGYHSDLVSSELAKLFPKHWERIVGPYVVPVASSGGNYDTCYSPTGWDGDVDDLPDGVWVADTDAISNIGNGQRLNISVRSGKETYKGPLGYIVFDNDAKVAFFEDHKAALDFVEATYGDRPFDIATAAVNYAASTLEEYSRWCSGEVFGCVVKTLDLKDPEAEEPEWVSRLDYDSCWGFIGEDYAMASLGSDFFDPAIKAVQEVTQ
jgi:hypothetical protein